MKAIICYYSGSGNTKLACNYITKSIPNVQWEMFNIVHGDIPDLTDYDIVGFGTFTDFVGPPELIIRFIDQLASYPDKAAFLLTTYGNMSGKTIRILKKLVTEKGFNVIAQHMLHMPENYPPMRKSGKKADDCPTHEQLEAFKLFVLKLNTLLKDGLSDKIKPIKQRLSLIDLLIPKMPRKMSKRDMGTLIVNRMKCVSCGLCAKECPYDAITMDPTPKFDSQLCYGCWHCYNHCPTKAIHTDKISSDFQYAKPIKPLLKKLGK